MNENDIDQIVTKGKMKLDEEQGRNNRLVERKVQAKQELNRYLEATKEETQQLENSDNNTTEGKKVRVRRQIVENRENHKDLIKVTGSTSYLKLDQLNFLPNNRELKFKVNTGSRISIGIGGSDKITIDFSRNLVRNAKQIKVNGKIVTLQNNQVILDSGKLISIISGGNSLDIDIVLKDDAKLKATDDIKVNYYRSSFFSETNETINMSLSPLVNLSDKAKKEAKEEIEKLKNLDSMQKQKEKDAIDNLLMPSEINKILNNAKQKDKEVGQAKDAEKAELDKLQKEIENLPHLGKEDKNYYKNIINKSNTITEGKKAFDEGKEKNNDLGNRKKKGNEQINKLKNISSSEKNNYNKEIGAVTTVSGPISESQKIIDKILDKAKAKDAENGLNAAKEAGKKVINELPNLSDAEKGEATKRKNEKKLPNTGEKQDELFLSLVGALSLSIGSIGVIKSKRKEDNET